jgi:PKD repeat protein
VAENPGYTTVYLKGPFTYVIDNTLLIGSNTILEGDSTAVIKLADHAGWSAMKPLIQQMSSSGNNNITVRGFEVNGNYAGNSEITLGRGYYNVIYFTLCNNVKVYNMYMHDGMGDGLRINHGKNIQFYNNKIYKLGHDGLYAIGSENVEAWDNKITCRINSGLRIWNSNKVKFHDNLIESFYHWSAGGPGIQIEKSEGIMDNIEIYNNTIHNTYGPGIWILNYDPSPATRDQGKNLRIHHNIFYSTGTNPSITWVGGIVASGFHDTLVENNVFDGAYHAAVIHMFSTNYSPNGGYTTIVRNNIIVNTQKRTKDPTGTGSAVINYLPETHFFVLENNCLFNNVGGNYKNCASTTDFYLNPLFADQKNHDYHLQSVAGRWNGKTWVEDKLTSPCIDAGCSYSDYSNEPVPNGNRTNIGPDGNTIYASKSGLNVSTPILPTANFSSNKTTGYAPLSVQFTDMSKNATGWKWDFGDRTYSTQRNPMHIYSAAGNYTVNLTASNGNGMDSKLATFAVMRSIPKITWSNPADIVYGTALGGNQLNVSSTVPGTFVYSPVTGTVLSAGEQILHADFIPNDAANYSGTSANVTINVLKSTPTVYWTNPASIVYGTALSNYQLNANVSVPGTFVYNPVPGTILRTGAQILHVDYTPNDTANYTIASKNVTINVSEKPVLPEANFSTNVTSGIVPLSVQFTDQSKNTTGWNWNFGDSSNSTQQNPIHTYLVAGNYTATLTVRNSNGTDSLTRNLRVVKKEIISNLSAIYNNRLREASPESIFSNYSFLDVGRLRGIGRYRDVIWFDLSGKSSAAKIDNATLSIFWYYPNSPRLNDTVIDIYRPASIWNSSYVSWNKKDNNIAWSNHGGDWYDKNGILQGSTPYATLSLKASSLTSNSYCEFDVTNLVGEYTSGKYSNTGFFIKARNESDNYVAFYSAQCGNANEVPKLKLVYN